MKVQTTRFFEVDEGYENEVLEAAKEYGTTALYSDGDLMLHGSVGDVKDVIYHGFELYDENDFNSERNQNQPLKSVLNRLDPEVQNLGEFDLEASTAREGFQYLFGDNSAQSDQYTDAKVAMADGSGQPPHRKNPRYNEDGEPYTVDDEDVTKAESAISEIDD